MPRRAWPSFSAIDGKSAPHGLTLLLGALGYFVLARLGLSLASLHESASPVWPASGFALALLIVYGPRHWPAIALGAFAANALTGGIVTALPITLGNTAEGLLGLWIYRHVVAVKPSQLPIARSAAIVGAAVAAPLASAGIGILTLVAAKALGAADPSDVLLTWWAGDVLGILLVTPLLLAWRQDRGKRIAADRSDDVLRCICLGVATVAAAWLAFRQPGWGVAIFLALPAVLFAARWFGCLGASIVVFLTGIAWLAGTLEGYGPFTEPALNAALINMQVMLAALAIAGLVLAEVVRPKPAGPDLVFLVGSGIAAIIFLAVAENHTAVDERHFNNLIARTSGQIEDRMGLYVSALQGGASLYAASRDVRRAEWHNYVSSLDIFARHPGIFGIGIVVPADPAARQAFIGAARKDGFPDFDIHPLPGVAPADAAYPQQFVVIYAEPEEANRPAIGLDLASEPGRRNAALAARDTGQPIITPRVKLVQTGKPGFLLFVPMYREPLETLTAASMRWSFHGWVFAAFAADRFFAPSMPADGRELRLQVLDGVHPAQGDLLYDSDAADGVTPKPFLRERETQLPLYGRTYTLRWQRGPDFQAQGRQIPVLFSAGLILFATLLSALVAMLMSQKDRAMAIAEEMNAALRASNARFTLAVSCSRDGVWDHDVASDTVWSSPRYREIYGYDETDPRDHWTFWRSTILPEDLPRAQQQYDEMMAGTRDGIDMVQRYRHRLGHIVHVHSRALPVRDDAGRVTRVVGVHTDISLVVKLEQQLKEAISVMADGFAICDADDRIVLFNESFVNAGTRKAIGDPTGCRFEEVVRAFVEHDMPDAVDPAFDREAWIQQRMDRHRNPPPEPIEVRWGGDRWMRISERRTADGGYVGVWTDVTEIKRLGQRLHHAVDSLNEGFILVDADGRYVLFNDEFLRLYPKTAPFVTIGASFAASLEQGALAGEYPGITTPADAAAFAREWSARFMDPAAYQGEGAFADGRWVLIGHHGTDGGGFVNVYTDITAMKTREADLARAKHRLEEQAGMLIQLAEELEGAKDAAESANVSKSHFLANMSHELRTPLNGILGFAEIIKTEMFGAVQPAQYRSYADDIHKSGQHLLKLINDLLDLSKIEAERMTLNIDAIETASAVGQAMRLVENLARERGVQLATPDIAGCPVLHADDTQIRQILLNLMSNAVKFTPDNGTVALRVVDDGDAGAIITVRDTGIGMTPAEIKTAMERFGQAEASYSKTMSGTGLGLPLVDGLVKLHGGTLTIDSEKGQGTTVTVRLPWHDGLYRQNSAAQ